MSLKSIEPLCALSTYQHAHLQILIHKLISDILLHFQPTSAVHEFLKTLGIGPAMTHVSHGRSMAGHCTVITYYFSFPVTWFVPTPQCTLISHSLWQTNHPHLKYIIIIMVIQETVTLTDFCIRQCIRSLQGNMPNPHCIQPQNKIAIHRAGTRSSSFK